MFLHFYIIFLVTLSANLFRMGSKHRSESRKSKANSESIPFHKYFDIFIQAANHDKIAEFIFQQKEFFLLFFLPTKMLQIPVIDFLLLKGRCDTIFGYLHCNKH